ncbi:MAG: leucine-rich repeat protein [Clostridiales bacterium]|jgi:hypothetical protein|nr:leucine-rich repeat protein [Clostridiales bacterium]
MKQTKVKAILIFAIVCLTSVFVLSACKLKYYDVVFMNDGEVYKTITVRENRTISAYHMPRPPVKDGYFFGGWVYYDDEDVAFDRSTKITADIVLTAKWYIPELLFTPIVGGYDVGVGTMTKATEIVIPQEYNGEPVLSIDDSFGACTQLVKLTIPFIGATLDGTINTHFGYIFGASRKNSSVYQPRELVITGGTSVGDYAFYGYNNLRSITIPDNVTNIGDYAFYGCNNLRSITIPDNVISIGDYAFYNCNELTEITIPNGVPNIGNYVFYYCSKLTEIIIPDSVLSIGV